MMPRPWWRAVIGTRQVASCLEVARVLQCYLDGELDQLSARRVERHLEICRRCGLEASTYTEIKSALRRHGEPPSAATVHKLQQFAEHLSKDPPVEPATGPAEG